MVRIATDTSDASNISNDYSSYVFTLYPYMDRERLIREKIQRKLRVHRNGVIYGFICLGHMRKNFEDGIDARKMEAFKVLHVSLPPFNV